jgi:predicted helicase
MPEEVFDYIYAILHSPQYREKYKEFLKSDFPRVPIPTQAEFDRLVPLGRELRGLHLMKAPIDYETTFPEAGSGVVEQLGYGDGKVWINQTQYFGNVPELAWNFYIGGYQPAQKWLKDRKGRALSNDDLDHYQKIIKILLETDRIMKAIG